MSSALLFSSSSSPPSSASLSLFRMNISFSSSPTAAAAATAAATDRHLAIDGYEHSSGRRFLATTTAAVMASPPLLPSPSPSSSPATAARILPVAALAALLFKQGASLRQLFASSTSSLWHRVASPIARMAEQPPSVAYSYVYANTNTNTAAAHYTGLLSLTTGVRYFHRASRLPLSPPSPLSLPHRTLFNASRGNISFPSAFDHSSVSSSSSRGNSGLNSKTTTDASSGSVFEYLFSDSGKKTGDAQKASSAEDGSSPSGTPAQPLHVVVSQPSGKTQFWSLVRQIALVSILMAYASVFFEERTGLGKGMTNNSEVKPEANSKYKFSDVAGVDEAKEELAEIVEYLRDPAKFRRLGGKLPKGILLFGPPGTGKTLLAKAISNEAKASFFYASGSEFDELYVGVGSKRIRELFAAAKKKAPAIIFIDEIDAIGSSRSAKDQQFSKMTLNQLLIEMDGFKANEGVIVIAATNFPELLDKALVRPGRFDRHVTVPLPDVAGRKSILEVHMQNVPKGPDVNLNIIARGTPGFSGAELAEIINQAALKASVEGRPFVTMDHLEYAKDKILMGAERKSAVIDDKVKRVTAYHEGGHALVALLSQGAHPIHKATIMPRGRALGMVSQLPEKDEVSVSKRQMLARMEVAMGGRVAEEMIFGSDNITSGASSDIEQATALAKAMVTKYGMSEKVGHVTHDDGDMDKLSGETKSLIEKEIKTLTESAYQQAANILRTHEKELHRIANALIEYETLNAEELKLVLQGKPIGRDPISKPAK